MWTKWFPWRFIVRKLARAQGYADPFAILARASRFAQPSEVLMPGELVRDGIVFHARGLMNSQAIQHNLDWVWPYWVVKQFDPRGSSFVPRAFSLTHINLTYRNWTAVGLPNFDEFPIVDPRGLLTPFYDSWSIDAWVITPQEKLIPSRLKEADQKLIWDPNLAVVTESRSNGLALKSRIEAISESGIPVCQISLEGLAPTQGWIVVSARPYNPEGVSFIHTIALSEDKKSWSIDGHYNVYWSQTPDRFPVSKYRIGDVFHELDEPVTEGKVTCEVGMATAAVMFEIKPNQKREVTIKIPLVKNEKLPAKPAEGVIRKPAAQLWKESLEGHCQLKISDSWLQFLYDAAVRTLILHSPDDCYPGPYTYKRFWFRDAAIILHSMLCLGLTKAVEKVLDRFPSRQTPFGYFLSQDGEWDSNGEALWILERFCKLTNRKPKKEWHTMIDRGAKWIQKKRKKKGDDSPHDGLLPPGFSAEHLGPNDYYYWDDFWAVAGLRAAANMMDDYGEGEKARDLRNEADDLFQAIERSLEKVKNRLGHLGLPSSPYRRMDTGSIGSLAGGYPLQLWSKDDPRLLATVNFLLKECFVHGGFFHDMSHSGINPYLTLHVGQILMRAGDPRFIGTINAIAKLASPTGQWPEAIHPNTLGGCMGDGQHVWAAAEWILMIRNCFVREEDGKLILCSGIVKNWLTQGDLAFGPALTSFGTLSIRIKTTQGKTHVEWDGNWWNEEPPIEIQFPEQDAVEVAQGKNEIDLNDHRS
jgi:hypothetical protein